MLLKRLQQNTDLILLVIFLASVRPLIFPLPERIGLISVGIALLFIIPGYLLLRALSLIQPGEARPIDLALIGSISLIIQSLIGLGILLITELTPGLYYTVNLIYMVLMGVWIAALRLRTEPPDFQLRFDTTRWFSSLRSLSVLHGLELVAVIFVIGAAWTFWIQSETLEPRYTEFYLLAPALPAGTYPEQTQKGIPVDISVAIHNHEFQRANYELSYRINLGEGVLLEDIGLEADAEYVIDVMIDLPETSGTHRVDLVLMHDDSGQSVQELTLWIDVFE